MSFVKPCHRPASPGPAVGTGRGRGFTLIEMLTTLSVLAVSLALAAPALSGLVSGNRVRAAQGELVSSLMLARSEAARRGVVAGVRATVDAADGGFARGWTVWIDANENGTFDSGDATLRSVPSFGTSITMTETHSLRDVVYSPRGFLVGGAVVTVCVASTDGKVWRVRVEPVGLADTTENITCP